MELYKQQAIDAAMAAVAVAVPIAAILLSAWILYMVISWMSSGGETSKETSHPSGHDALGRVQQKYGKEVYKNR